MDSHKYPYVYGAAEECNSCESGWTMYIGSPRESKENEFISYNNEQSESESDSESDGNQNHYNIYRANSTKHVENSDDSMVSDASSGPSRRWEIRKASGGQKKCELKAVQHRRSSYKAEEEEEEEEVDDAKVAKFVGKSSVKVRKNYGFGKRK